MFILPSHLQVYSRVIYRFINQCCGMCVIESVVHQGLMSGVDMNKANSSSNCCSRFRCAGATSQHLGYRINSHCSPLTILYRPTQPCLDCFASTVLPTNFVTNYRPKGSCQPLFRPWAKTFIVDRQAAVSFEAPWTQKSIFELKIDLLAFVEPPANSVTEWIVLGLVTLLEHL